MTHSERSLLRTSGSPLAHARLLNAQYIVPDKDGVWAVAFRPSFEIQRSDFQRMAELIATTPGLRIVQDELALAFTLDCSGVHDPEKSLDRVYNLLRVARRDHVIATRYIDPEHPEATVEMLFRRRRTDGELLDLANSAAAQCGVDSAEPSGENEITLTLDAHGSTPHGAEMVIGTIAAHADAYVLEIITKDVPPVSNKATKATSVLPAAPWSSAPVELPPFAAPIPSSGGARRRRRATFLRRGHRVTRVD